ncbi:protein kinase domain-containing protein [Magnetospirillum sulfuroxidans]|uniref:SIR2 family protein n=1 Tax=Magnetospirillum sulfuroxidans TaxID=611300 RepID=A0ABS5IH92_9PROT|nr:SIR2 family protein [Magnetospirillum sulfuroxidans]MBR9973799.1 SIR2 family protein [Magnetospirillum sulfuroxidans]
MRNQALESLLTLREEDAKAKEIELDQIYETENLWEAFQILHTVMGEATYRAAIREIFEAAEKIEPPDIYKEIWELDGVSSFLTLNIDKFAYKAHRKVRISEDVANFCGKDAGDYLHLVKRRKPFIANLHGIHESAKSWVFTKDDFTRLSNDPQYVNFINFVIQDFTIVFMGISADDVAAGGFLERLISNGIDLGQHFWITDRCDSETDRWASKAGVQVIRYEPEANVAAPLDHTTILKQIFADLKEFISKDELAPAVVGSVSPLDSIPSEKELRLLDDDDKLRLTLAGHAKALIERNHGDTQCNEYQAFLQNYSRVIHQVWHLTSRNPHNKFHGYSVVDKVSSSPFSSVWKLVDESGCAYALKIIQMDNLSNGEQLDSFRRGVQCLEYLTKAAVPGTAKIITAFEIPTCVLMDFIDGDNFKNIINSTQFKFWTDGIRILRSVCRHVEFSHNLPQGVLHRDIRPSNVIVPWFYWRDSALESTDADRYEVALLNFDMSWHAKAQGRTISGNIEEAGYYAPEQLEDIDCQQARSTKVDSYGIGMTIFTAYTGLTPPTGGSKSVDWKDKIRTKFRYDPTLSWKSAPKRLARLIDNATCHDIAHRINVRHIRAELDQLQDAVDGIWDELSPDFWAEELFAKVLDRDYTSNPAGDEFQKELKVGRIVSIRGNLQARSVSVQFRNVATGVTDWTNVDKRWGNKLETAKEILKTQGWDVLDTTRYSQREIHLEVAVSIDSLKVNFSKLANALERGLSQIRLD